MRRVTLRGPTAALLVLALAACVDAPTSAPRVRPSAPRSLLAAAQPENHLVTLAGSNVPADFAARVSDLGGNVERLLPGIGAAVVSGLTEEMAGRLAASGGVQAVERDRILGPDAGDDEPATPEAPSAFNVGPPADALAADVAADALATPGSPAAATFYARQWNLRAIHADAAWAAGQLGSSGTTVFLLDTGIDYTIPELVGRVDLAQSVSLVPSEDDTIARLYHGARLPFLDLHSHGTAVASLIVSNAGRVPGARLAGVTQQTTLVAVKVHDKTRSGPLSVYLAGIMYAADHDADIIHLSIPFIDFSKDSLPGTIALINRALNYAHQKGAVLVTPAANASVDFDHDGDHWRFCNGVHVICVSSTAPDSSGGPSGPWPENWRNVDAPAPNTNFGRSAIDVAGPGGYFPTDAITKKTIPNTGLTVWVVCSTAARVTTGNPVPCSRGAAIWETAGNTFAAAATSGLAALLVANIGKGRPDEIRHAIERAADDLGTPGTDPYYGRGRINVGRAVASLR